jgi:uncharacterized Zn finger protein
MWTPPGLKVVSKPQILKRIIKLLKRKEKRDREWTSYLEYLREDHFRKKRLMEILDGLDGKPIVKSGRK